MWRILTSIIFNMYIFMLAFNANAENLYVCATGQGSTNGSSWANCFNGWADISWGTGAGTVGPGDTLYVGAGNYGTALTVGYAGTSSTSRVTIKAAQDTQVGVATFTSLSLNRNYVTIDGEYNGSRNFTVTGRAGGGCSYPIIRYINFTQTSGGTNDANDYANDWSNCAYVDIGYSVFDIRGSTYGVALNMGQPTHPRAFAQGIIHHNIFELPKPSSGAGNGPDGIHSGMGYDYAYNIIRSTPRSGTINTNQHQDYHQLQDSYTRMYGNTYIKPADSAIDYDAGYQVQPNYIYIYNNVFILTSGGGIRFYGYDSGTKMSSITNTIIENNTFVDHTSGHQYCIGWYNFTSNSTISGISIKNNIFYNTTGNTVDIKYLNSGSANFPNHTQSAFGYDYNLFYNGGSCSIDGSACSQAHTQSGQPQFVDYTAGSALSDLRLTSSDTAAKDHGYTSSYFAIDKDVTPRPQGAAWDIGAYESTINNPPPLKNPQPPTVINVE